MCNQIRTSHFCTRACQVFTTQKLSLSEMSLTMKAAESGTLRTHFMIKLPYVKHPLKSILSTSQETHSFCGSRKVNISIPSVYFPFSFNFSIEMK